LADEGIRKNEEVGPGKKRKKSCLGEGFVYETERKGGVY